MIKFLIKRLAMMVGILLVISVAIYGLLVIAVDPLADLRMDPSPNKEQKIASRVAMLGLDKPWYERYLAWLIKLLRGDLGQNWQSGQPVIKQLGPAMGISLKLIFAASLLAILLGVTVGVFSALRQYTGFDYIITIFSFVMFSLPVFWLAVMLKQWGAIGMNDFLTNPVPNWTAIVIAAVLIGLLIMAAGGGNLRRQAITFVSVAVVSFGILAFVFAGGWLLNPSLGPLGVLAITLGVGIAATTTFAGIRNRRALGAALTTTAITVVMYFAMKWLFYFVEMSYLHLFGLLLLAVLVACAVGWFWGGPDRGISMRVAALTAIMGSVSIFVDQVMVQWQDYMKIINRPIATIGAETPNFEGSFWMVQVDTFTHILLPSISLILISFAGYARYQRGALLEVLNQDYIRTARAKGLTERVVIVRHALRNALMPLASMIPPDLMAMIGGAIMTETIFGWAGMGKYFRDSLANAEIDGVMAYVLILGAIAMLANLVSDFLYALLDPRIKVNA